MSLGLSEHQGALNHQCFTDGAAAEEADLGMGSIDLYWAAVGSIGRKAVWVPGPVLTGSASICKWF